MYRHKQVESMSVGRANYDDLAFDVPMSKGEPAFVEAELATMCRHEVRRSQ